MKLKVFGLVSSAVLGAILMLGMTTSAQVVPVDDHGFMIATPEDLIPKEGRSVTIFGNPSEPGLYVIQITWAPGQGSRPHFHDQARYINVLKGTWYVATGPESDVYNPDSMTPVHAGTFIYEPPNGHHYDMAKDEEVIVQIFGIGPVTTTQIPQS